MPSDAMTARDLRDRSRDELVAFVQEKSEELFKLKFQHYTGQLDNTARLKTVKRELARARTIITELDRGIFVARPAPVEPPAAPAEDQVDADDEQDEDQENEDKE